MQRKLRYVQFNMGMWVAILCSIAVAILSLILMIGWIVHSEMIIKTMPYISPMQFNVALCLALNSIALLLGLFRQYNRLRITLALFTGTIALLTLVQHLLKTNLGIDTLFINPFISYTQNPGRMAYRAALGLIFISFSLLLFPSHIRIRLSRYRAFIISFFSSFCFALGLVPLLGYLTGIETAYSWGKFNIISIETAIGFILISIAINCYVWNRSERDPFWLPIPIFIAFLATTLFMSAALYTKELINFNQNLESNTNNAATLTQQNLEDLIEALERMANRWEKAGTTPSALWHADAQAYIHDFPYLLALEVLDNNLVIRHIEPLMDTPLFVGKNLNNDPERKHYIEEAISTRAPTLSASLVLKQGGQGFLCFIPLFKNNQFTGMLVSVFRANDFFNSIFTKAPFLSYHTAIFEQGKLIYSNADTTKIPRLRHAYQSAIHYKNIRWEIRLTPNANAMMQRVSKTYLVVFAFGFIMTLLLTLCAYLILDGYEKSKKLAASEYRYWMILNGIKDYAIFMLTPTGKVNSWNNAAQKINGYTYEEIIGKHFSIFYSAEDIANHVPAHILKTAKKQGRYESEGVRIRKDGSQFWANTLIEPLYDDEQELIGFVKITRNISDKRQMELERSKLISLIEESSDFFGIADLEGKLQYHNRSAKRMVGLPDNYEMSQLHINDIHPAWANQKITNEALPTVYAQGYWTGESALLHRNGQEIPVLQSITLHRTPNGEPSCFTTIMRDITERKAQEEAIKESEETFRSAMQYASIGMALVSPDGQWLKVNQALCSMIGYTEEELLKTDFQTITHPEDLKIDIGNLVKMLNKQIDSYQMEKRYFHKDGHIIWALLSVSLLWNAEGKPRYFISQIQNVSARKQAEEANEKLMAALESSNAELERFAYVASHDLQEPIRMINNFSDLLLTEKHDLLDGEAKEYLQIMTNAGTRLREMINDLLTYSRVDKETTPFVVFSGEETLGHALENLHTLIEETKTQVTHESLPMLYGNPMQIMRLLQNLIANSIKYRRPEITATIHIDVEDLENNWCICIKDNGLGIEEQFIKEIFEPFRRLHTWDSIKGSGLGLSICKKIAEVHGGTLTVTSTPGTGSIFFFIIPKHPKQQQEFGHDQ